MAKLMSYLSFKNAKEAIAYYEEVFGAENYGRMPVLPEMAEQFGVSINHLEDSTMHAAFGILGNTICCSDSFGGPDTLEKSHMLMIDFNSEDEEEMAKLESLYAKVSAHRDTEIIEELKEQFWGGKMAQFIDRYGITWMLHAQPYSKLEAESV